MVAPDRMDAFLLKSHIYNALPIVIALTAIAISVFLVGVRGGKPMEKRKLLQRMLFSFLWQAFCFYSVSG